MYVSKPSHNSQCTLGFVISNKDYNFIILYSVVQTGKKISRLFHKTKTLLLISKIFGK